MTARRTRRLLLWCAATDATFELDGDGSQARLCGKCIHCQRRLTLQADGTPLSRATVEHIVPQTHGGGETLENLAIACARCNQGKGSRHDHRRWEDEGLQRVITTLLTRRRERMRQPLPGLDLPQPPVPHEAEPAAVKEGD